MHKDIVQQNRSTVKTCLKYIFQNHPSVTGWSIKMTDLSEKQILDDRIAIVRQLFKHTGLGQFVDKVFSTPSSKTTYNHWWYFSVGTTIRSVCKFIRCVFMLNITCIAECAQIPGVSEVWYWSGLENIYGLLLIYHHINTINKIQSLMRRFKWY